MKNVLQLAALAAITIGISTQAHSALLTHNGSITSSNQAGSVDYFSFSTNATGNVRIETFDAQFDTMLWLFPDKSNLIASDTIAGDDDNGTPGISDRGFSHSKINMNLEAGDYIAAVGDFLLTIAEAISGVNDSSSDGVGSGNYRLEVDGPSVLDQVAVVPPTTTPPTVIPPTVIPPTITPTPPTVTPGGNNPPTSTVSEPMTLGLFGLAIAGFGAIRRRRT